jgi:hypothetical protein
VARGECGLGRLHVRGSVGVSELPISLSFWVKLVGARNSIETTHYRRKELVEMLSVLLSFAGKDIPIYYDTNVMQMHHTSCLNSRRVCLNSSFLSSSVTIWVKFSTQDSETVGACKASCNSRRVIRQGMSTTKVKCIGKYELGGTIGEGTFSKVRFAENIETGEAVAIKILDKEKVLEHKMVEQVTFKYCCIFLVFSDISHLVSSGPFLPVLPPISAFIFLI